MKGYFINNLNKSFIFLIILLSTSLLANVATITALKGSSKIQRLSTFLEAKLGLSISEKDSIVTSDNSKVQLVFKDETIITIGKNSNFSVNEYLYDEMHDNTAAEFGLTRGIMRTITGRIGKIAPERFKVKTANAIIGIRGTNFTVKILASGVQRVYCTFGAISVKIISSDSELTIKQGFFIEIKKDLTSVIKEFSAQDLKKLYEEETIPNSDEAQQDTKNDSENVNLLDDGQLDTTNTGTSEVSTQTQKSDTLQDSIVIDDTSDELNPDAQSTPSGFTDGVIINYTNGFGVITNTWDEIQDVSVDASSSAGVVSGSAYLSYWIDGGSDYYYLYLSNDTFTSKDDFSYSFDDIEFELSGGSPNYVNNLVINPAKDYFRTLSDLDADDDMSWGEWALDATFDYDDDDYAGTPDIAGSINEQGLWIAGNATSDAIINGYVNTNIVYDGEYRALVVGNPTLQSGVAQLKVNFSTSRAELTINNVNGKTLIYNQGLGNDIQLSGALFDGVNKTVNVNGTDEAVAGDVHGYFYGATGASAGGSFNYRNGGVREVDGVYQVKTLSPLN